MITEYYTDKEITNEINKAIDKCNDMLNGWFGIKLVKLMKQCKNVTFITQQFTLNKQVYFIKITLTKETYKNGDCSIVIYTSYETRNGKMLIYFDRYGHIYMLSPHYRKREGERMLSDFMLIDKIKGTKYTRNNKEYELLTHDDDIIISRRSKENNKMIYFITLLNRDIVTSKNYTELLSRIDNQIDSCDVYNWK